MRFTEEFMEAKLVALVDRLFKPGPHPPPRTESATELATWNQLVRLANLIEALGVLASEKAHSEGETAPNRGTSEERVVATRSRLETWGAPPRSRTAGREDHLLGIREKNRPVRSA
jgi:hypothetical protein